MIAEGNTVMVKQKLKGTHKNQFQDILATSRTISNEGFALYELSDGKIIQHQVHSDRLGFFQQLGVLPTALPTSERTGTSVYFVDKFLIPKDVVNVFTARMNHNRNFIKSLPGFISDDVIASEGTNGDEVL